MPASTEKRRLMRHVHAAARELNLNDETRRELQERVTGQASTSDMSPAQLGLVIEELKRLGWRPSGRGGVRKEERGDLRFIWVLWLKLADKGLVGRDRAALNAFVNSTKFGAKWGHTPTELRFICRDRAADVIEALKVMCKRNGVEVRP